MEEYQNIPSENGTSQPVNKLNSAAVNGLKLAVISIIFSLIASLIPQNMGGAFIGIIITLAKLGATITFLWWAMKTFSAKNAAAQGFTTYGNVFSYGLLTSLFSGIVLAVYSFINLKWINPDSVQAMKDAYLTQLENTGSGIDLSSIELIFNNLEVVSVIGTLISAVIYGLIFSAILASSTKIEPHQFNNFNNFSN